MQPRNQDYEQLRVLSKIIIDPEYCDKIIHKYDTDLERVIQQSFRDVQIKNININDILDLKNNIISANEIHYKFDLNYDQSDCFFARYDTGMHYQSFHLDCIAGEQQRKLSFSLLLNEEFTGGEFELLEGAPIPTKKGKLLVFPSFLPHKITPITSQTRYVIFGWFYGPNFI
jgi:predicted 2-oxoglutarate/Fe(II)-dependent dioxygenase YbiX